MKLDHKFYDYRLIISILKRLIQFFLIKDFFLSMKSRKLTTLDGFYNSSGGMVQFVIKVKNPNKIQNILTTLNQNVLGFRLTTNSDSIFSKIQDAHIFKIPDNLDLNEAGQYMYLNHTLPFSEALGTLGYNNNCIVMNMSHQIADGRYCTFVLDYLTNRRDSPTDILPINMENTLDSKIKESNIKLPHLFLDKDITRIYQKKNVKHPEKFKIAKHISFNFPTRELRCYNKEKNICHGLTDALWSSFILSAFAFNGGIQNQNAGCTTCIDMRKYIDSSLINWAACNIYSSVTVASPINESMTLSTFEANLRKDLTRKLNEGYQYAFLKTLTPPPPGMNIPGIGLELTNLGPFYVKDPITDVFFKSSVSDKNCDPLFSLSSFSVVSSSKNHFYVNMRYKPSIFNDDDARSVGLGTRFALRHLSPSMTIKESIKFISDFQSHLH